MYKILFILLFSFVLLVESGAKVVPLEKNGEKSITIEDNLNYRLPKNLQPSKYELELTLNEDSFKHNSFYGNVSIYISVEESTDTIEIHSNLLKIDLIEVFDAATPDVPLEISDDFINSENHILTIKLEEKLTESKNYVLKINYTGILDEHSMKGFYKSTYKENGEVKYLASTQFESTSARQAFPCFDEPGFKATLELTVNHPDQYTVISNTEPEDCVDKKALACTKFRETPPMSTYLYAFIVSEFDFTEGRPIADQPNQIKSRVWSRKEAKSTRQLVVNETTRLIESLGKITGLPYQDFNDVTLKMDQVAIPDFSAGAMENWAAVTYRERAVLWDETQSSDRFKQSILQTVAHELTHHWFGNLVTLEWWSAVFLNEGFANYFGYQALHRAGDDKDSQIENYTTWEMDKQYVVQEVQSALRYDSQNISEALYSPEINTPEEISSHFGTISYSKGGSILRMFENVVTEEKFNEGLTRYLETFKYKNTKPTDLWDKLGLNQAMARGWTEQPGYPLLTVIHKGNNIIISQKRFLTVGTDNLNQKWYVPISFANSKDSNFDNTTFTHLLTPETDLVIENAVLNNGWVLLNIQQKGYYRIEYDYILWQRLQAGLEKENFDGIPELNRAQIVDDTFNLARAGILNYVDVIKSLRFLENDTSLYPWHPALNGFSYVLNHIDDETENNLKSSLNKVLSKWLAKVYEKFARFDQEFKHIDAIKQILIVTRACSLGFESCTNNAVNLFKQYKENPDNLIPYRNLRGIVFCEGLRHSENPRNDFDFLWRKFENTDLSTEEVTLLNAFGCSKDSRVLKSYLEKLLATNTQIRRQDINTVFASIFTNNNEGVVASTDFLKESSDVLISTYGLNTFKSLLNNIVSRIANYDQVQQLFQVAVAFKNNNEIRKEIIKAGEKANKNLREYKLWKEPIEEYFNIKEDEDDTEFSVRLPRKLIPTKYELELTLKEDSFKKNTFSGKVLIHFKANETTNQISIHSNLIDIKEIEITQFDLAENVFEIKSKSTNSTLDILNLKLHSNFLENKNYVLRIDYEGILDNNNTRGFYQSRYLENEQQKYVATTHFEPLSARQAFPCFDEPSFKVPLQLTMYHPKQYNALSNTQPGK